jgi:hypothetical protein
MLSADELFSDGQTFTERADASAALVNQTFIERANHFVRDQGKKKKKSLPDFAKIQPGFAMITVEGILRKNIKSGHVRHT